VFLSRYCDGDQIKTVEMVGHAAHMAENRNAHRVGLFVRRPEEKRPCGRKRRKWDDNIKINFKYIG
jgi:hypothetical protein